MATLVSFRPAPQNNTLHPPTVIPLVSTPSTRAQAPQASRQTTTHHAIAAHIDAPANVAENTAPTESSTGTDNSLESKQEKQQTLSAAPAFTSTSGNPHETLQQAKPDYAYNPKPEYPLPLREQGVGGVVWLRVWVDGEGRPSEVILVRGSGYRLFDESALHAVRHWRFIPARLGEQTQAAWVEFPIRFSMNT